jgi:hypothetical protein
MNNRRMMRFICLMKRTIPALFLLSDRSNASSPDYFFDWSDVVNNRRMISFIKPMKRFIGA